ncbi:hypothetical protein HK405_001173 [Cladochytrium tenue]|nr:hypothetical protein HK405_001173 [Cladochytrium tenue]
MTFTPRYAEFFEQGREEMRCGLRISADVMDPANEPEIPRMQVDFYKAIVTPAFEFLEQLCSGPDTAGLARRARANAANWAALVEERRRRVLARAEEAVATAL